MWASSIDQRKLTRTESGGPTNLWHRDDARQDASRVPLPFDPTEEEGLDGDRIRAPSGTWGEPDVGEFDAQDALGDFEELRKNLTELERARSKGTTHSLRKVPTVSSLRTRRTRSPGRTQSVHTTDTRASGQPDRSDEPRDVEAGAQEDSGDEFELEQFMRDGHFEKRNAAGSAKRVGVIYKDLVVKGVGSTATFVKTLPQAVSRDFLLHTPLSTNVFVGRWNFRPRSLSYCMLSHPRSRTASR